MSGEPLAAASELWSAGDGDGDGDGDVSVESLAVTTYTVPTDAPEADATLSWESTTLVLVEVTASGCSGTGWTYGPAACAAVIADQLTDVVVGRDAMAVTAAFEAMVAAVRNAGRPGAVGYAISAVDVALWDLKARLLGLPLYRLLGAAHPMVPVYGSGGFTSYPNDRLTEQLTEWVHGQGIPRVKIKIGDCQGSRAGRDLERMAEARAAVGSGVELYVDANGGYQSKQAVRVMREAAELDVRWFEEPVSSDDLGGLREVREQVTADVTAGEYGYDLTYFARMCAAGAVDCLQVDVTRCGGITEWMRVAAVAAAHHLQVSGHCAPHLHAHPAAATANLRHLEWFHDHVRIEEMFFDGTLDPAGGAIRPYSRALGHGLDLRRDVAARYQTGPTRRTEHQR